MILSVRVNNFMAFEKSLEFSLIADKGIKKFGCNLLKDKTGFEVLKSACIYGANNAGKTCLLRAVAALKSVLSGGDPEIFPNLFSESTKCSLGISFLYESKAYSYDLICDLKGQKPEYVYEKFAQISLKKGELTEKELFLKDTSGGVFRIDGKEQNELLRYISVSDILIYAMNANEPFVRSCHDILCGFADKIEILMLDNIPIDKTIKVLKENRELREKTVNLIKLADLDIDDYLYLSENNKPFMPHEEALKGFDDDGLKLTTMRSGKAMQSLLYDSTGTKKLIALSSYIVEALEQGKVLVVDELDSSLHFKLTRAIVALFNNELTDAQLIFTAHDIDLLDCKKLFRHDQIWFAVKNSGSATLISMASAAKSGKSEPSLVDKYKMGLFGGLPKPNFISLLIDDSEEDDDE